MLSYWKITKSFYIHHFLQHTKFQLTSEDRNIQIIPSKASLYNTEKGLITLTWYSFCIFFHNWNWKHNTSYKSNRHNKIIINLFQTCDRSIYKNSLRNIIFQSDLKKKMYLFENLHILTSK